jgi:hypothetical protein
MMVKIFLIILLFCSFSSFSQSDRELLLEIIKQQVTEKTVRNRHKYSESIEGGGRKQSKFERNTFPIWNALKITK